MRCPEASLFSELRESLITNLQRAFGEIENPDLPDGVDVEDPVNGKQVSIEVRYIPRQRLSTLVRSKANDEFWIALDDIYISPKEADAVLRVSRVFDVNGRRIGVASRYPKVSISDEVSQCVAKYNESGRGKRVVLADDGTYSGGTIVEAIKWLKARHITVDRIYLGFCTKDGETKIYDELEALQYPPVEIGASLMVDKRNVFVWVCERDFYLGAPRSGRTLGKRTLNKEAETSDSEIGFSYVMPFAGKRKGGNIEQGDWNGFSRSQVRDSIKLWEAIESVNSIAKPFTVEDIGRFPGPGASDKYEQYRRKPWIEYIRDVVAPYFDI
jgi:hypothetical protein